MKYLTRQKDYGSKGSITIFALLSLLLTLGFLLGLLEAGRYQVLSNCATRQTAIAKEAIEASYQKTLWEEYHLLATDYDMAQEALWNYTNGRNSAVEWRNNLVELPVQQASIETYIRMTDGEGRVFVALVSEYMTDQLLYESAKTVYGWYEAVKSVVGPEGEKEDVIQDALEELEGAKRARSGTSSGTENPLQNIHQIRNAGILQFVIEDQSVLSAKEVDLSQSLSKRTLREGTEDIGEEGNWYDQVLLQQYFVHYLSSFQEVKENRALDYELEYLIGGKNKDADNLKAAINRIILIREGLNLLYLSNDETKVEAANALALSICTALYVPEAYELVGVAILAAWAYGESILDARALLQGKRIPLLKSEETWTLGLENLGHITEDYATAIHSDTGLGYQEYLGILILMSKQDKLAVRGMEMQEQTIRLQTQNIEFGMDQLIVQSNICVQYGYEPVFGILKNNKILIERKAARDVSLYLSSH